MHSNYEKNKAPRITSSALDNSEVIDFFALASSALLEGGVVSERDCDAFRISISGQSSSRQSTNLLDDLAVQNDVLSMFLTKLLGEKALYTTLLSNQMNSHFSEIVGTIGDVTLELTNIAKLYFNRSLTYKISDDERNTVLASQYFESISDNIISDLKEIKSHYQKCLYMTPLTGEQTTLQLSVMQSVGATHHESTYLPAALLRKKLSKIFLSLRNIISDISNNLSIIEGSENSDAYQLEVSANMINAKIDEITSIYSTNIGPREFGAQKAALSDSYNNLKQKINEFTKLVLSYARQINTNASSFDLTESERRLIFLKVSEKGLPPLVVDRSIEDLDQYLKSNNICLDNIIQQELKKIAEPLSGIDLDKMRSNSKEIKFGEPGKKKQILERLENTSERLKKIMHQLVIIIPFIGIIGCGVKTAPTPVTEAVRPEVPYSLNAKNKSNNEEKKLKTIPDNQNDTETK